MIGQTVSHYRILEKLGFGGMGVVYKAKDTRLDRFVALKFLSEDASQDVQALERFRGEAKAASALNHPNICTIYDIGEENGKTFIGMELLEGVPLNCLIAGKPLDLDRIFTVGSDVSDALTAAHSRGIVHRDIKPANIFVAKNGRAKVLDFGLAKHMTLAEDTAMSELSTFGPMTEAGTPLGTYGYMSPEQALGRELDHRTDLFSYGATLYEMATGKVPFPGKTPAEVYDAILHRAPIPPLELNREVPDRLQEIIQKCIEKDPKLRYQSASEIGADLRRMRRDSESATSGAGGIWEKPDVNLWARFSKRAQAVAITLALVIGIGLWIRHRLHSAATVQTSAAMAAPEIHSLAVLPLKNLSGDPSQEYFADGITLDLITTLTKINNLNVISWTSVRGYKNSTKSLPEIAKELNVDGVIDGSVERSDSRVRITTQLIHASSDHNLWAESYDRELGDILSLQEEVAGTIAREIRVALTPQDRARLSSARPVNSEAYLLYSQGRAKMQRWAAENSQAARRSFLQAIEKDPSYAPAYAGLAESYLTGQNLDPKLSLPLARAAANKALALDDMLGDAHVASAQVKLADWDWEGSEKEFKRAIELNPGDTLAHHLYSHLLLTLGRNDESLKESELYVRLDPLSAAAYDHLGFHYLADGKYELSIEAYRKTKLVDPTWESSHHSLGDAYRHQGMSQEALAEYERAMAIAGANSDVVQALRDTFQKDGWRGYWEKQLRIDLAKVKHEYVSRGTFATYYALLGDQEKALHYLDEAFASHDDTLAGIKVDRDLDVLHAEPRYIDLLKRMGLPR